MAKQVDLSNLTSRQRNIFEFIQDLILNRGYGPSVREIGDHFGIRSPNGVMCHLRALEKKGVIKREAKLSRAITLEGKPSSSTSIEILGQLSNGSPLEAGGQPAEFGELLGDEDHACVRIQDDSYARDGLAKGDYVLIRKQETCKKDDRVLVVIDGQNAALKRYHNDANGVRLEPLSGAGKTLRPTAVAVLGIVVGMVRKM